MRITNTQKADLNSIFNKLALNADLFDFTGEDDIYSTKFNDNYFEFNIKKISSSDYDCTVRSVDNKTLVSNRLRWESVVSYYERWLSAISKDIANVISNKKMKNAEKTFSNEIEKYSKNFILIYNQALKAEVNSLTEICGLGYRKAFEFLIKDYLIKKNKKEEHKKIKEMLIAPCINTYVTDDQIKLLSHRVLWLGNDHAHYTKRWKGKTLEDLKKLIDLTIQWIKIKDELDRVHKSMPQGKK